MKTVPHTTHSILHSFFPTPSFLKMDAIGVDISDQSLKFIELKEKEVHFEPKQWGRIKVPDGAIQKGRITDHEKLVSILRQLHKKTGVPFVHASLPEEHAYLFQIKVDKDIEKEELFTAIEFNLRENVPIPPEQAVFSYEIVPYSDAKETYLFGNKDDEEIEEIIDDKISLSVSVYPIEIVDQYLKAFEDAGMKVLSFEVEAQAVARAVTPENDNDVHMVLDIGTSKIGLAIINQGILVFTSTLEIGGEDFKEAIKKSLGVSDEEANEIKNEKGFVQSPGNKEVFSALFSSMSVLKDEVNKHFTFWNSEQGEKGSGKIEHIYLCGGNANIKGLPEYLEANIGVSTMLANVWINAVPFDEHIPKIPRKHSLEYATAIGLALRSARK